MPKLVTHFGRNLAEGIFSLSNTLSQAATLKLVTRGQFYHIQFNVSLRVYRKLGGLNVGKKLKCFPRYFCIWYSLLKIIIVTLEVKSIGIEPSSGNCNNVTVIIASSMLNSDYKMSVLLKELKMWATLSLLFNFYNWRPVQKIRQQHFGSASIYCPSFFYQTILRGVLHTYLVGIGGGIRTHVLLSQNFGSWWWSSGHSACLLL